MNFVDFVTQKARACGWRVSEVLSENMVVLTFSTEFGSGSEQVYVRPCGKTPDGNTVIEFTSTGIAVPADQQVAHDFAFELLRRNGNMLMGHWGIEKVSEKEYFTVFATLIANTMDADEFKGAVEAILNERQLIFKLLQSASIAF